MARKRSSSDANFTARDVLGALNNAVLMSSKPSRAPLRKRQNLREYAMALLEPTQQHVDDELLTPEELVFVLSVAAMFVQMRHVMQTDAVPMAKEVKAIFDGETE
jgi:hypothetical protein